MHCIIFAEASNAETYIGVGAVGTLLLVLNQLFNLYTRNRELKTQQARDDLAVKKDAVAVRKDELALCVEEDDHAIAGYEKLLARYNTRLVEAESELKEHRKLLSECQQEHARSQERVKHLEEGMTEINRKYENLKRRVGGSNVVSELMPEKKPNSNS